ncbi:MAG: hypothetical protein HY706_22025 [Candidatus Hydrogenedentes bacterium]|nr:hypothetical protein [Candidatus Hydrogenedentota bacterium]
MGRYLASEQFRSQFPLELNGRQSHDGRPCRIQLRASRLGKPCPRSKIGEKMKALFFQIPTFGRRWVPFELHHDVAGTRRIFSYRELDRA